MAATVYASTADVQDRMAREMPENERAICQALLEDAAVMIDAYAQKAEAEAKKVVSCRMVIRALGDGQSTGTPLGATQGSMSALGYSQSWTIGSGGSVGELYISKSDRLLLGKGNAIGSYSPVQELAAEVLI